jgi:hypothetical protein
MSKSGGKARDAIDEIIISYMGRYRYGWARYGAIFSVFISGMLLVQARNFLDGGWMEPAEYLAVVFAFLFSSLILTFTKGFKTGPTYNKADEVAHYLGTKIPAPGFLPVRILLNTVFMVWLLSFLGIMYLDSVVTYDAIINTDMSLPSILTNALLVAQFLAPAFLGKTETAGKK